MSGQVIEHLVGEVMVGLAVIVFIWRFFGPDSGDDER